MAGAAEELAFYIEFTRGGATLGGAGLDCVEGAVAVLLNQDTQVSFYISCSSSLPV